jgi:hypothetical protein
MLEEMQEKVTVGDEILLGLEHILGRKITQALWVKLDYEYFGTGDIASVIEERPELFERAMKEILGPAGPAIVGRIRKDVNRRLAKR